MHRLLWNSLGWVCVAIGAIGIVLPGLPTTPFLLLAAWAFGKGDARLARWLEAHPKFGPLLRDWREHRVIPRHAKVAAVLFMTLSFVYLATWSPAPTVAVAAAGATMALVAGWILLCPSSRPQPVPLQTEAATSGETGARHGRRTGDGAPPGPHV